MFQPNDAHSQRSLFEGANLLPEKLRQRLETSWAGTFYREVFCRIDETLFAVLYSEKASRPNTPVNVLVALEILKSGFGWSDRELYEQLCFNLQVRYAVGLRELTAPVFELRTLYNFRQRLRAHAEETGTNLMARLFEQVTDAQLAAVAIDADWQRMDSTQVLSNLARQHRLELIVSVIQQVYQGMDASLQEGFTEQLAGYLEKRPHEVCYPIAKADRGEHLERLGRMLAQMVEVLSKKAPESEAALLAERVLSEQYEVASDGQIQLRPPGEVSAESVQSPHDVEATYRKKAGQRYRGGYVACVSETCAPESPVQLICDVQVAPNATDDAELLERSLERQAGRGCDPAKITVDGGFTGPVAEAACQQHQTQLRPTRLRGGQSASERLGWEAYQWEVDEAGRPEAVRCPQGERAAVEAGEAEDRYIVRFSMEACGDCPLFGGACRVVERRAGPTFYVTRRSIEVALQRRRLCPEDRSIRAPVEATMRELKRGFAGSTLPVRGLLRASMMLYGAAMMVNLRRLHRYGADRVARVVFMGLVLVLRRLQSAFRAGRETFSLRGSAETDVPPYAHAIQLLLQPAGLNQ